MLSCAHKNARQLSTDDAHFATHYGDDMNFFKAISSPSKSHIMREREAQLKLDVLKRRERDGEQVVAQRTFAEIEVSMLAKRGAK